MTNASNFSPINDWADGQNSDASRLFDYTVIANDGDKIGKVENVWMNDGEQHGFIAISTGWIFGRLCLIPMESLEIDHSAQRIRVPFSKDMVKNSPDVAEDYSVTSEEGQQVRSYYNVSGMSGMSTGTNTVVDSGATNRAGIDARMNDGIVDDRKLTDNTPIDRRTGDPGGYNIAAASASASMPTDTQRDVRHDDEAEIHLAKEEVEIGKREVDAGRVRLRKVVRTEVVNQPVELRREDVIIERVQDDGSSVNAGDAFAEDAVEIDLKREEVVVNKTVESAGTVRARKVTETEQQNVQETVRKEDVEVERNVTDQTPTKKRGKNQ
jgi:uncharacterized protein (TIGR02271 family)